MLVVAEGVGVFLAEVGLDTADGEAEVEVGDGFSLPLESLCFDVDVEDIARPAVFDGLTGVGEAPFRGFEAGEKNDVVTLGQLSNSLLDNCGVRPGLGEGAHVEQVGA